jgi:RNA polymerase sigma-70 factor, ECF subfamily
VGVNKLVGLHKNRELTKEETLEYLVDDYWISVKKLAYTYVKDWALAEDITQEVFIKCYTKMERFRGDSSMKTWLYKITVNRCKDEFKSKWYRTFQFLDGVKEKTLKNSISAEQSFLEEDERQEFYELVMALPMKYREVIILYYYEEMSLEEIHSLLETNINTVKTRLKRGKLLLKNMVAGGSFSGR